MSILTLGTAVCAASKATVVVGTVWIVVETSVVLIEMGASSEVATLESVAHARVTVSGTGSPVTTVIPASSTVHAPAVTATIDSIEVRPSEVEIVAVGIACIDAEVPVAGVPVEWTIEIGGFNISAILPVEQYVAEVQVTVLPVDAVEVLPAADVHQVVEVDFVGSLVLFLRHIQFIRHLVCQEESLLTSLFVTHGVCRCCEGEQCCEGDDKLFHIFSF